MSLSIRAFAGFVLMASVIVLGTALVSQYWGGLLPCELCLLQRWPWAAAIAISLVALIADRPAMLPWAALLLAIVFAFGMAVAFYHVGVEQHWFAGPSACTASSSGALTVEDMKRLIIGTQPVLCDRVQWSLLGVSMAGWNLLASLGMAAICAEVCRRSRRSASRAPATA